MSAKSDLLRRSNAAIALLDNTGVVVSCSDRFGSLLAEFGGTLDPLASSPLARTLQEEHARSIAGESPRLRTDALEDLHGSSRWLEIDCRRCITSIDGRPDEHGVSLSLRDVTEQQDRQEALQRHNEELVQFQYHVSHDLSAPIQSAKGLIGLIQEDLAAQDHDDIEEMVGETLGQIRRLERLIDSLMSLSQSSSANATPATIDLTELIDDIVEGLSSHSRELEVSVSLSFDRPTVRTDHIRLRQILANLISNARKFSDPEEPAPGIEVRVTHEPAQLVVDVEDNGLGMTPQVAATAFDMFSRGSSAHPGHGLGLYIVAKHVERLAGRVRVSNPGKPTRIQVTLPYPAEES